MGRPDYILSQFGKRVGGSKVNLFVIKITASGIGHLVCTRLVAAPQLRGLELRGLALTSQLHSLGGSRGRSLLCRAPRLVST